MSPAKKRFAEMSSFQAKHRQFMDIMRRNDIRTKIVRAGHELVREGKCDDNDMDVLGIALDRLLSEYGM